MNDNTTAENGFEITEPFFCQYLWVAARSSAQSNSVTNCLSNKLTCLTTVGKLMTVCLVPVYIFVLALIYMGTALAAEQSVEPVPPESRVSFSAQVNLTTDMQSSSTQASVVVATDIDTATAPEKPYVISSSTSDSDSDRVKISSLTVVIGPDLSPYISPLESQAMPMLFVAESEPSDAFVNTVYQGLPLSGVKGILVDLWRIWSEHTDITVRFVFSPTKLLHSLSMVEDSTLETGNAFVYMGFATSALSGWSWLRSVYQVQPGVYLLNSITGRDKTHINGVKGHQDSTTALTHSHLRLGLLDGQMAAHNKPLSEGELTLSALAASVEFNSFDQLDSIVRAVQRGELDGFIADPVQISHHMLASEIEREFTYLPAVSSFWHIGLMFAPDAQVKHYALAEQINDGFYRITPDQISLIESQWQNRQPLYTSGVLSPLVLAPQEQQYLRELQRLKVGYVANWPPFEFTSPEGMAGINASIAKRISQELALPLHTIPFNDFDTLLVALRSGEVDMVGSVFPSAERLLDMHFTDAYWLAPWAAVVRGRRSGLISYRELKDQRIAIVEGYHLAAAIKLLQPDSQLIYVADVPMGIGAVADNRADLFIDKLASLTQALPAQRELSLSILSEVAEQRSHIAVSYHQPELVPLINRIIARITESDRRAIYFSWVGQHTHTSLSAETPSYGRWGLLLLLPLVAYGLCRLRNIWLVRRHDQRIKSQTQLNGLVNQQVFADRLMQCIHYHHHGKTCFALMRLKMNVISHSASSVSTFQVNNEIARLITVIQTALREGDSMTQAGEHELMLLLPQLESRHGAQRFADNLRSLFPEISHSGAFNHGETVELAIDWALYPDDGEDPHALYHYLSQAPSLVASPAA